MSKTRTYEFVLQQSIRCVMEPGYIEHHRKAFKGTPLQKISDQYPDDEEFGEVILRRALREFLQDCLRAGFDDTPGLRGRFSPPRVERIDTFRRDRSEPVSGVAVLASEVSAAIPK